MSASDTPNKSAAVIAEIKDGLAILTMNHAPVNALSKAVRKGLIDAVSSALQQEEIRGLIITGEGALFSGGADISEFSGGNLEPHLPQVLDLIESSTKPIVAALNGNAFGGGLELALACHGRVTFAGNRVGLPEVNLGILPGAGGTQRLPRLIGVEKALSMIVSGAPAKADSLPDLFDVVTEDRAQLLDGATRLVNQLVSGDKPLRRTCDISLSADAETEALLQEAKQRAAAKRGFFAPLKCVEAVEAAVRLEFKAGLARESELFAACMDTPQARAQQHFFFAERAAQRVPDYDSKTPVREINKVGIIGAGTMGGGIAMNFANAGIPVTMLEQKQEALDKGLAIIRRNYENSARKGKLTQEQVEQRMALLQGSTSYEDLSDVDLVIEAVFEKMAVKKEVFSSLDAVCKPGCILASNTSTLDINDIATATSRPGDVIGLHFFSPANVMKLLEVVKTADTTADVIKTCMQMAKKINKVAALVGVCFGFVGNRMIETYAREANRLLLEGATPEQVDRVLVEFGMPMGPFTMGDMAGMDIGYFVRESRKELLAHDPSYCVVADRLVEKGYVGLKVGRGVYRYEEGSRKPIPDPEVLDIAKAEAARLGITQREISDQEILERCLYPLINEGAAILEEGIASKSSDIDVIYVYGYGFPVYRGGPMQYADEVGLGRLLERLNDYRQQLGAYGEAWFTPAPLLEKLVSEGKNFASLNA